MRPDELERRLRERLDALDGLSRDALLTLLEAPDVERAEFARRSRILSELLIESEEDPTVRVVLLGMLRPADRLKPPP